MNGPRGQDQRGAALLTALIIVTLISTVAVSMVWQQWRAVQVEAAERAQSQAQWVLRGALDWALLILREDARTNGQSDNLGEPWAVPLAESRLSTFLAADRDNSDDAPEAFLSGVIHDAQSRYNLYNLITPAGSPARAKEQATLATLCQLVGVPPEVATLITTRLNQAQPASAAGASSAPGGTPTAAPSSTTSEDAPLLPPSMDELGWLGIDADMRAKLAPQVVMLPKATLVNLNTASREVIAAVLGVNVADAERLVQLRLRSPLKALADAANALPAGALDANGSRVSVVSGYFEVVGAIRMDNLVVAQRSLVERQGMNLRVLRSDRVRRPEDIATSLQQ
jgi:general secretion pathway protein K